MAWKIYRLNNYIFAENQSDNSLLEAPLNETQITQRSLSSTQYRIHGLGDIPVLDISEILKEDGTAYTKAEFDLWYTDNTGFNTASGGSDAGNMDMETAEMQESSIFNQLSNWEIDNNASEIVAGLFGDLETVILEDNVTNATAHYALNSLLPLNTEQTVRIKVKRDLAATTSMLLRTTGAGTQELIINLDDGGTHVSNGGAGVDPVVNKTVITDNTIEVWATFQPNTGITMWDLFPAVGNQNIVGGGGFSPTSTGTLEIIELDLNSARPNNANTPIVVQGASGLHRIGLAPTVNIGTADTSFNTGFDLTQPGELMIRFIAADGGGAARDWESGFLNVDRMLERFNAGDTVDGFLHIFDNDFVVINLIDPTTGEFLIRETGRDVGIRAELWIVANTVSKRLGEMVHKKSTSFASDADAMSQGYLPIKQGTVTNGVLIYPLWSAIYTEFVIGNDIVLPTDVEGMFLRNIGGNSEVEGDFQDSDNKAHTHTHGRATNRTGNTANGGNSNRHPASGTGTTSSSGGVEARPLNRAYQLYSIIDTYLDLIPTIAQQPPFLQSSVPTIYRSTTDSILHSVTEYSNGEGDSIFNEANADGTFTRLLSIPTTYSEFVQLTPSLPNAQDFPSFWFQDQNQFIVNSQQNQNGQTLLWELFLSNVSYPTITNLEFVDNANNPVPGVNLTLVTQEQPDGTYHHSITTDTAVAAFQSIRLLGVTDATGASSGSGVRPSYANWYSN